MSGRTCREWTSVSGYMLEESLRRWSMDGARQAKAGGAARPTFDCLRRIDDLADDIEPKSMLSRRTDGGS